MLAIEEHCMKLELIWKNPFPVTKTPRIVCRVSGDDRSSTYSVINPDATRNFELIQGAA